MTETGTRKRAPLVHAGYFTARLAAIDPTIAHAIAEEYRRQSDVIELIASENIVSRAVLEAQGSLLTNKTVEGLPGRRYHGGAVNVDVVERVAIERATALFGCRFANVQPHSGSQANQAVFLALLEPGETVLAMALSAGGHLSHGAAVNQSGKHYRAIPYGVRRQDGLIDYDAVEALAREHRPKLVVAGGSSYPRAIDFARMRRIADGVGARLLVDMAHFAGLVAGGVHPSPIPHAHVVTTTTYKSLRGARGGIVLTNDEAIARLINAAVFPGMQGSPLLQVLAAKAVCLAEALRPEFRLYAHAVLENARTLAETLQKRGYDLVSGGTDTPLMLIDLRRQGLKGLAASESLDRAGITCNKNAVPFDEEKPTVTSGIRLGVSACTTRGFGVEEFRRIGGFIAEVLDGHARDPGGNDAVEGKIYAEVKKLTRRFPIYPPDAVA
ncbi:MAG TPA: serine hydroxymethyltransferase [Alphaproteobacteria bacterium]|nr:serine hydroxymethyltransferase [Alphaproteobacteria bacterium]